MSLTVKFENGSSVAMAGRACYSETIQYLDDPNDACSILQVGDDAGVIVPEYNAIGLFDGAGGADDIGSPRLAARLACEAVKQYFRLGGGDVSEALQGAREAVSMNKDAGVCVGAVMRITDGRVTVANAGDTAVALYQEGADDEYPYIAEPQRDEFGDPLNYLGSCEIPGRLSERISDDYACRELYPGDRLFLMTDGAWVVEHGSLETYHLAAAMEEWPLFEQVKDLYPNLEKEIRDALRSDKARKLCEREVAASTDNLGRVCEDWVSKGLLDPDQYTLRDTNWLIWREVIKPYLESAHLLPKQKISMTAIAGALLSRPVRWPFEAPPQDDATVAMVEFR